MRSILRAIKTRRLVDVEASVVITDNPRAGGIAIAKKFDIATEILPSSGLRGWPYDKNLLSLLEKHDVLPNNGLICLAGYMRILSAEFVQRYEMRIINVHPSLLPSFPGLHAQRQALEYGVKISGCTIHFVNEGVDSGSILLQQPVRVLDSDSEETLSKRILIQEHKLYPEAIKLIAEKRIVLRGRKAMLI